MHLRFDNPIFKRVFMFGLLLAVAVYLHRTDRHENFWSARPTGRRDVTFFAAGADFWRWQPHPRSGCWWGVVATLAGVRRCGSLGPKVVPAGQAVW